MAYTVFPQNQWRGQPDNLVPLSKFQVLHHY